MRGAWTTDAARRHKSCPAVQYPSHHPVSAKPKDGWRSDTGKDGLSALPSPALGPGTAHIPGRTQTWQWRTGSARCRGHQRSPGGCRRGCVPWTLRGFSGRGQSQQPTESALQGPAPQPPPTHSMTTPCPWQGSTLFRLMPHSGPPQLTMAFLKYTDSALSSSFRPIFPLYLWAGGCHYSFYSESQEGPAAPTHWPPGTWPCFQITSG